MRNLSRRRRNVSHFQAISAVENLEERTMLDASGVVAEAAGFSYFESRSDFAEHLVQQALTQNENRFGNAAWFWNGYPYAFDGSTDSISLVSPLRNSDTNTQVDGVDEPDIIENDGKYLYLIQQGNLVIVHSGKGDDTAIPETMSVVANVNLGGSAQAIFLHEGTLTVIATDWSNGDDVWLGESERFIIDDIYWPGNTKTLVTSYDVSNPAEPSLLQQTTLDGSYLDARAIDGQIHVFTNNNVNLPGPRTVVVAGDFTPDYELGDYDVRWSRQYESRETYETWIRSQIDTLVDDALPTYEMVGANGVAASGLISDFDEIAKLEGTDTNSLVSITTIDPTADRLGLVGSTSVFANAHGARYATAEHLYLSTSVYSDSGAQTQIMQFTWATDEANIELVAEGTVDGGLLNQFAMDKHDGYLRVATTSRDFGEDARVPANNVFVLEAVDGRLNQVGAIERFEEGETIFAVRFSGDRAFVVTFEQIDPLFMIDLSDPTSPEITGELEVPGFSTYLQRIDDDHLLAVGQIDGTTKVSLYDISDATDPTLVDEDVMPKWSWSTATQDHHAFGWYSEHSTLAIPVTNGNWRTGYRSELMIFDVDPSREGEDAIKRRGTVSDEGTTVQRSAYIDDVLYTVTTSSVIATDLTGRDILGRVGDIGEPDDGSDQPLKLDSTFMIDVNGTSDWRDVSLVLSNPGQLLRFLHSAAGSEFQVLVPDQVDSLSPVSVTMSGSTLSVSSEEGVETIEVPADTQLVIRGTEGANAIDIDLSGAGDGVLKSLFVKSHGGNDIVNVNGIPDGLAFAKVSGGRGDDTIVVDAAMTSRLMLFGGKGDDNLGGGSGNEVLSGGQGNDTMHGGVGNDRLIGREGNDFMWGGDGHDAILGGADDDRMYGGRGNDTMLGGRGNDRMHGSNGADVLTGSEGDDMLFGNYGDDTFVDAVTSTIADHLAGGSGQDRYVIGTVPAQEVIDRLFDFTTAEDLLTELWDT